MPCCQVQSLESLKRKKLSLDVPDEVSLKGEGKGLTRNERERGVLETRVDGAIWE